MMTSKFLADAEIERRANRLLGRYEARSLSEKQCSKR